MSSEVEICNLALSHIKAGTINSMVNTSSEAARKCALYFGPARDAVLRDHQWNFAQKIRSLAPFTMPEGYGNRFRYAYMYPVDALKVHRVYAANSSTKSEFDVKRAPTNEKIILTNAMQHGLNTRCG
jgi:hypothetical protein